MATRFFSSKEAPLSRKSIKLYGMRMQIEAGFRDQKSVRFGLGSDLHRTNKLYRLDILLLLATLAHWFSMMLGAVIDKAGKTGAFQANSTKKRRVVSWAFVGLRYFKKQSIKLRRRDYFGRTSLFRTGGSATRLEKYGCE